MFIAGKFSSSVNGPWLPVRYVTNNQTYHGICGIDQSGHTKGLIGHWFEWDAVGSEIAEVWWIYVLPYKSFIFPELALQLQAAAGWNQRVQTFKMYLDSILCIYINMWENMGKQQAWSWCSWFRYPHPFEAWTQCGSQVDVPHIGTAGTEVGWFFALWAQTVCI